MAYNDSHDLSSGTESSDQGIMLQADGQSSIDLPDASFVRDADLTRDGMDLVLEGPEGTITIEGYFAAETSPDLVAPGGETLTPDLVESFSTSPMQYAQSGTLDDVSPVGAVDEISGEATVTRVDGSVDNVTLGTPIYQGDIIETGAEGAVNISFIDETSFAVSEEARLSIDEYVFDPSTNSGVTDFSVLKGVFVFTSGLIGRDDPDDVTIDTPVGSIGIRGTIIAGDVDTGEITVIEGAIVLRDFGGNELTLATQFETGRFNPVDNVIEYIGQRSANDMGQRFNSVADVSPTLFSSIDDAAREAPTQPRGPEPQDQAGDDIDVIDAANGEQPPAEGRPDGTVDQNADGQVDGTLGAGPDGQPGEPAFDGQPGPGPDGPANLGPQGFKPIHIPQNTNNPFETDNPFEEAKLFKDTSSNEENKDNNDTKGNEESNDEQGSAGEEGVGSTPDDVAKDNDDKDLKDDLRDDILNNLNDLPPPGALGNQQLPDGPTNSFSVNISSTGPITESNIPGSVTLATLNPAGGALDTSNFRVMLRNFDTGLYQDESHRFEIVSNGNGTFDVQTIASEYIDFEDLKFDDLLNTSNNMQIRLELHDTNGNGFNHTGGLSVINADDEITTHTDFAPNSAGYDYFAASEGTVWEYNYGSEFFSEDAYNNLADHNSSNAPDLNGDGYQDLLFTLNGATISLLNGMTGTFLDGAQGDGYIFNGSENDGALVTTGDENNGWTFDQHTGDLKLYFKSTFGAGGTSFNITVDADGGTLDSTTTDAFNIIDSIVAFGGIANNATPQTASDAAGTTNDSGVTLGNSAQNKTLFFNGGNDTGIVVNGSNNEIYLGQGDDVIALFGPGSAVTGNSVFTGHGNDTVNIAWADGTNVFVQGGNNTINIGATGASDNNNIDIEGGTNTITLHDNATNTYVEGGHGIEHFVLKDVDHTLYGNEGDDIFEIDLGTSALTRLNALSTGVLMDGGHDELGNGGLGDVLKFGGSAVSNETVDFSNIEDNFIQGIEVINTENSSDGYNVTIQLTFDEVINMTDGRNELFIDVDDGDGDVLHFDYSAQGASDISQTGETVNYDGETYDVYEFTDGSESVTLFVDQDATLSGEIA